MPLTFILASTRKADVVFNKKKGTINISRYVVEKLDIEEGDSIDIVADDFETFIVVKKHPKGQRHSAQCYRTNKSCNCKHMRVTSKKLCTYMAQRFDNDIVRLSVGDMQLLKDHGKALPFINRNLV